MSLFPPWGDWLLVYSWELGKEQPNLPSIFLLREVFWVSPKELAWEEEGWVWLKELRTNGGAKAMRRDFLSLATSRERDLKTLDLKVRGEGVHHHPVERAAPLRERLGNNLEG